MISFAQPIYLAALSSLLLVLIIHLLNKRDPKPVFFSSIKLFKHSESQKVKKIVFNEFWLFLIRSLIITFLVFIIAEPLTHSNNEIDKEKWLLIEPNIPNELIQIKIDSLEKIGYKKHYLTPNFEEKRLKMKWNLNIWSLLSEASKVADKIHVITRSRINNYRLERPILDAEIQFSHIEAVGQIQTDIFNGKLAKQTFQFEVNSSSYLSKIKRIKTDKDANPLRNIKIHIYYSSNFKTDLIYIKAAIEAIKKTGIQSIEVQEFNINDKLKFANPNWLIWLSDEPFPYSNTQRSKLLIYNQIDSEQYVSRTDTSFTLNHRLLPSKNSLIFSDQLPTQLAELFLELPHDKIKKADHRILSSNQITPIKTSNLNPNIKKQGRKVSAVNILFPLVILLLLTERYYTTRKKR